MAATLHQHGHDHDRSGFHDHSHGSSDQPHGSHSHGHGFFSKLRKKLNQSREGEYNKDSMEDASKAICEGGEFQQGLHRPYTIESHHEYHSHKHQKEEEPTPPYHERENINVRAAFIHVIGDLLQSLGVMVAAMVIYFKVN